MITYFGACEMCQQCHGADCATAVCPEDDPAALVESGAVLCEECQADLDNEPEPGE